MISCAYLRAYLPAAMAPSLDTHAGEGVPGRVRITEHLMWDEPMSNDAFTITWADETYVCPRHPRLRMLEAALAFARANPTSGLVPGSATQRITNQLAQLKTDMPAARSHILTSSWHVPLRWFAVFDPDEREMYEMASGDPSIRYRTPLASARRRAARAVEILDESGFDDSIVDDVRDLHDWIAGFSSEGILELDYATTARLFDPRDLLLDESTADVQASLRALDSHDFDQAGRSYAAVAGRWAVAQSLSYAN